MIIYPTGILTLLLLFAVWMVGTYLFAAAARLFLGQLPAARETVLYQALQQIVDPLPGRIEHWLLSWRRRPSPAWVSWAIVIVGAVIVRHVLFCAIIEITQV